MLIVDPNYDGDKVRGCSPPPVLTPAQNEGVEVAASSSPSPPSLDYFVPTNNEDIRPIKINTHFQIPLKVLTQSSLSGGGSDSAYHSFLSDDASENSSPGSKHGYQSQNKHPTESSFLTRLNIAGSTFCENNRLGTAEEDSPCVRLRQRLETPNSEQKRGSHVLRRKQLPPPLKKPYKKENSTPSIGITQQLEKSTTPCNKINFHKISKNVPNTFPKCSPLRISLIKAPLAPSPPKSVGNVVKKRSGNNFRSHLTIKQVDSEEGFSGGGTPRLNIKTLKNHHRTLRLISDWRPASEGVFCKVKIAIGQPPAMHLCYTAVRHRTMQEVVSVGDCVKIHSSENLENVGRIISLHYDEEKSALLVTLLWFYTPSQLDSKSTDVPWGALASNELLASKHIDTISADCIESLAYVLTFNEYCRYRAETEADSLPTEHQPAEDSELWPRGDENYNRRSLLPHDDTPMEAVYFCRGTYGIRSKKIHTLYKAARLPH